jgi:hypothetical protein
MENTCLHLRLTVVLNSPRLASFFSNEQSHVINTSAE